MLKTLSRVKNIFLRNKHFQIKKSNIKLGTYTSFLTTIERSIGKKLIKTHKNSKFNTYRRIKKKIVAHIFGVSTKGSDILKLKRLALNDINKLINFNSKNKPLGKNIYKQKQLSSLDLFLQKKSKNLIFSLAKAPRYFKLFKRSKLLSKYESLHTQPKFSKQKRKTKIKWLKQMKAQNISSLKNFEYINNLIMSTGYIKKISSQLTNQNLTNSNKSNILEAQSLKSKVGVLNRHSKVTKILDLLDTNLYFTSLSHNFKNSKSIKHVNKNLIKIRQKKYKHKKKFKTLKRVKSQF